MTTSLSTISKAGAVDHHYKLPTSLPHPTSSWSSAQSRNNVAAMVDSKYKYFIIIRFEVSQGRILDLLTGHIESEQMRCRIDIVQCRREETDRNNQI